MVSIHYRADVGQHSQEAGGRNALPSQMGTFFLYPQVKGLRFMKKRIRRKAQVVQHTKKTTVFGEHLLCSGTSQILRIGKPEVESVDSNLCMAIFTGEVWHL